MRSCGFCPEGGEPSPEGGLWVTWSGEPVVIYIYTFKIEAPRGIDFANLQELAMMVLQ